LIPVAGILADRYGRKPLLVGSLLIFGLAGAGIAATTSFRVVLGLRLIQGSGFAGLVPIITTSIGDMYEGRREATGQGLRMFTNGVSGALFPLLAGALILIAWQVPFLLYALAVPVALIVFLRFEEPTDDTGAEDTVDGEGPSYRAALLHLFSRRRVLAIVFARSSPAIVWVGFLTYNSLIVARLLGGTALQAGLLAALGNLALGFGASQSGRMTAVFGSRFYGLLLGHVFLVAGLPIVLFAPAIEVAALGTTMAGAGFGISVTLYRSILTGMTTPDLRGGLVSLSSSGSRVTATVTPIAMGAIIAAADPVVGLQSAIRLAGLAVTIGGGGGGLLFLLVAHTAPAVGPDPARSGLG
jgi:MFS family permease